MSETENIGMSISAACRYLGIGKTKMYDLLSCNEFPNAYKVGTSVAVPLFDLMAYRKRNTAVFS